MQLDMMLVYEWIDDDNAKLIYPVNILRNYARLQVCMYGKIPYPLKNYFYHEMIRHALFMHRQGHL